MAKDYVYYLFDFDLTLADSSRGIVMCFTNVLQRHGFFDVTELQIKRTIGKTLEESFAILTGISDPAQLSALKQEYTKEADIYMNDNTVLFPETVEVLTKLKNDGAKLAIISTKYRYRIQAVIDKHFPQGFIDVIIGGEDVKQAKPHPQGVKTALKKLKAKKELSLYVGDSTVDAETARNAGIDFCGVLNGLTTYDELAAYPHRKILPNLTLLPLLLKDAKRKVQKRFIPLKWEIRRRAFNIRQIRGSQSKPLISLEQHICQNCGDVYEGDYCRSCGQPAQTNRITLKSSFSNFFSSFFSIETGFLHTIFELWYRPGYMAADFIRGKRKPYYKPFSLLIVMAALFIVANHIFDPASIGGDSSENDQPAKQQIDSLQADAKPSDIDTLKIPAVADSLANDSIIKNDIKERVYSELGKRIDEYYTPGTFLYAVGDLLGGWFGDNQAFLFIATIPFYIFGVRRAFRHTRVNKRLNTGEYAFIMGYFGSQFIMKDMLLIPFFGSDIATRMAIGAPFAMSSVIEFLLMTRNLKQLFHLDWWTTLKCTVKTYLYMAISLMMAILAAIFIFILLIIAIRAIVVGLNL